MGPAGAVKTPAQVSSILLMLCLTFGAQHLLPVDAQGCQTPEPSPSQPGLAPSPSLPSAAGVDSLTLFPRVPNSFNNVARNAVIGWNLAVQWAVRQTNTSNVAGRTIALVNLGIWQALVANRMSSNPANSTAVAAYAGHLYMMNFYPSFYSQYDQLLLRETVGLSADELARAQAIASKQIVELLTSRLDDGSQDVGQIPPACAPPGYFRDVSSGNFRSFSQFSTTRPLLIPEDEYSVDFLANFTEPYQYPSEAYDVQYTSSYLLGGINSTTRQPFETETAYFWADTGTGIAAHWNQLAIATMPANITLEDSAELMALLNVALFDSIVTGYKLKYRYNRWRPITAIRDGDALHVADAEWTPLLTTPNNPTYPATQTALAGAAEIILASFYGTDAYTFSIGSEYVLNNQSLNVRTYPTFSSAATEVTESRYLGGNEFQVDSAAGRVLGRQVAGYVLDNFDKLLPTV